MFRMFGNLIVGRVCVCNPCDNWVPVTTAWRVLKLRMEERPPIWRVATNILNKQSRTVDKVWFSSLGLWRGANNASPSKKKPCYVTLTRRGRALVSAVMNFRVP
jgi:hypothetical protein